MVFQTPEDIFKQIEFPKNKELIERGKKIYEHHEIHVEGKHIDTFLKRIDKIENQEALDLRKKLANAITMSITSKLLNPINKVFSTPGTLRFYDIENDNDKVAFKQFLNTGFKNGDNLKEFIERYGQKKLNVDPNGLLFIEIDLEGKILLTYKCIEDIHDISYNSIIDIDYIIFNYENEILSKDYDYYRVIDDNYDYVISKKKKDADNKNYLNNYAIIEELTFKNYFNKPPAVVLSDNLDNKEEDVKNSYIFEALPLLDDYLLDNTIHKIYKLKIGVPYVWEMASACSSCNGSGEISSSFENELRIGSCHDCNGTGIARERNISDKFILKPLPQGEQLPIPPAGFVQPDISTHDVQVSELNRIRDEIYECVWNTSTGQEKRQNNTAYEVSVLKSSENSKLIKISKNFAKLEKGLTDLLGYFFLGEKYKGSIINYGTNFEFRSEDELLNIYETAKEKKASEQILSKLYNDYLQTKFEANAIEFDRQTKIFFACPYPHYQYIDVAQYLTSLESEIKKNYSLYIVRYDTEVNKIELSTLQEIIAQITIWAQTNIIL